MSSTITVRRKSPESGPPLQLSVRFERALTGIGGEEGAHLLRVSDERESRPRIEEALSEAEKEAIRAETGLPIIEPLEWEREPRWWRVEGGRGYRRVAYERHGRVDWIGGKGYVHSDVVSVWRPERGATRGDAAASAGWGERFALILTPGEFARKTFPAEHLPPLGREAARRKLTADPGQPELCRFVKRTSGELRRMLFRYEPGRGSRHQTLEKGLLPVWDLEKRGP